MSATRRAPYPDDRLVDPRPQGTEEGPERNYAALKRPWSANPEEAPHPETEIGCTGVHEQSLQDVLVSADVRATHATGFVEMRAVAFEQFAASGEGGVCRARRGCAADWHTQHHVRRVDRSTIVVRGQAR